MRCVFAREHRSVRHTTSLHVAIFGSSELLELFVR